MGNEYRKVETNRDRLFEMYRTGFIRERDSGRYIGFDNETGLCFIYPEKLYKLWDGSLLKPDYMRKDNGLLKAAFCREYASDVRGNFAYACGTYSEPDSRRQFMFSFDAEQKPEKCLTYILVRYSWNNLDSVKAEELPREVVRCAKILYGFTTKSDYGYDGVQCFVVPADNDAYREVVLDYHSNLCELLARANANLDAFDQRKGLWKEKAFQAIAAPAVHASKKTKILKDLSIDMSDEAMIVKYKDHLSEKPRVEEYRFDAIGWRHFMTVYSNYVSKDLLNGKRMPLAIFGRDEIPV